jgi:hypothetical protein
MAQKDINILALVKESEKYVFLYDDQSRQETLRTLGRFASNPELSFTWYDAAVLSNRLRKSQPLDASQNRLFLPSPTGEEE